MKKSNLISIFKGKIIEVVNYTVTYGKDEEQGSFTAEVARRSPGVRLLLDDKQQQKILLTREARAETGGWDYRLPGGKVFDSLSDYIDHAENDDILLEKASIAADKECEEEAGYKVLHKQFLHRSIAGASVTWDLYYFLVDQFELTQQKLEEGELITKDWYSYEDTKAMCLDGSISEDRSVAVLLRHLLKNQ